MGQQDAVLNVGTKLVQGTQQAFSAIAKGFSSIAKGMRVMADASRAAGDAANAAKYDKFASSMSKATGEILEQTNALDKLQGEYEETAVKQKKLTDATEKQAQALAKQAATSQKAASTKEGKSSSAADNKAIQDKKVLVDHLHLSYEKLIDSTEVYGRKAKEVMTQLWHNKMDPLRAADEIVSLDRRRNAYQKLSVEVAHLTSLYPKEAAILAASGKSYAKQADILNKLKIAKEKIAVATQKQAVADEKAQTKAAATLSKTQNQIKGLTFDYTKLLNSQTKYGNQAQQLIGSLLGVGNNFSLVSKKIRRLNQEFKTSQMSAKQTAAAYKKLIQGNPEFRKRIIEYQKLGKNVDKLKEALERLHRMRKKAEQTKVDNAKRAKQIQLLTLRYDKLINSTDKYGKRARQIQALLQKDPALIDRVSKSYQVLAARQARVFRGMTPLQQGMQRLGKSFKTYLSYMAASSAIFAVLQVFREATTTVIEYDQALKDLQAITQSTDEDVAAMGETIKQVASDTKFSAVETAEGMKLLGQSGLSATESIETIAAVADLATGTLTDMDTTVDLLTTSMRVFDIAAEDSARISDVWANAVNRSKLTIDKIRTAMNYIGPVAAAVGISIEDVAGSMMIMANQGIRASTIGTGLRQVFRRLVDPSKEMSNAMTHAGLSMKDFDPRVKGLQKVFDNLKLIVTDSGDAFQMFGQRGATAVLAITKGGGAALSDMLDIVQRTGTAADMAATQMEGLGVSFKNLQDKVKNLYVAMGDNGLAGSLRTFVDLARGFVDFLTGVFSSAWVQLATKVLLLGAAATALGKTLIWLSTIIKAQLAASVARAGIAMAGYAGATTAATGATGLLTRSLIGLKAMLASTGVGLFVIAIGSLLAYMAGAEDRIADAGREFKAMRLKVSDNIMALEGMKKALEDVATTEDEVIGFTQKLAKKYEDYKERIKEAGDSTEDIIVILDELIEKERAVDATNMAKQFKNNLKGMLNEISKMKANEGFDGFIRDLLGGDSDKVYTESETKFKKFADDAAAIFIKAKEKAGGSLTLQDFMSSGGVKGLGLSQSDLVKNFEKVTEAITKSVEDAEEKAAEKAEKVGRTIGDAIVDGVILANTPEELAAAVTDFKDEFRKDIQTEETALTKSLYKIEELEARGIITHEDAEMQKLNATIDMYNKMLVIALEYQKKAEISGNTELMAAAAEKVLKETGKVYKIHLDKLKKFGKERAKLEKDLVKEQKATTKDVAEYDKALTEDREKEEKLRNASTKALADKRKDIEKNVADKIKDINKTLHDKLNDLRKERLDREKDMLRDLAGIQSSADDKVLNIQQRGMTDTQKEVSNRQAAEKRYYDAQAALSKAKKTRDLDDLAVAKDLYESSSGYYESLKSSGQAVSGIRRIESALKETRKLQLVLEKEGIGVKETTAVKEAAQKRREVQQEAKIQLNEFKTSEAEKLQLALDGITKAAEKRKTEHDETMRQHREEIVIIKEKIALKQQRIADVIASMDSLPLDSVRGDMEGGVPSLADYGLDENGNEIKEVVSDGVKDGIEDGISRSEWKEAGTGVKEPIKQGTKQGVEDGLFEGVEVNGMPLEEWKKKGVKSGEALLEGIGFAIERDAEGVPVAVTIHSDADQSATDIITEIQAKLDEYPGDVQLTTEEAQASLERFIRAAANRTITVKLKTEQAAATGGPAVAMAKGGRLPGQDSPEDKVHVMARPGEWFIKNESVKSWTNSVGDWFMKGVNAPGSAAGRRLHELLDLNGSITTQNRNIKKLASKTAGRDTSMGDFGTINFQLAPGEPPIEAAMSQPSVDEMMRQLNKIGRLSS